MPKKPELQSTILIVDDEPSVLSSLSDMIKSWGYKTLSAFSGSDALHIIDSKHVDLVVADQMMPGMDGLTLLRHIKENNKDLPFIMLTGHGSIEKAIIALKTGAADYLLKPCKQDEMELSIARALEKSRLSQENRELKEYSASHYGFDKIITKSSSMLHAIELASKIAEIPKATIALYGESGTGKELLARSIHQRSGCIESRFVAVNCAGIPEALLENELFGHVKGSFTGAYEDRQGKFDLARQGTILLDEIGDMPLDIQPKLLRVLEERCYEKIGANKLIDTDLRIITATHKDLEKQVVYGKFRRDLFHRINRFTIFLPSLRERREDIPLLANHFLDEFRQELGKPLPGISKAAMDVLMEHSWPGNVRELKNLVERAAIITDGELIRPDHLSADTRKARRPDNGKMVHLDIRLPADDFSLNAAIEKIKEVALKRCDGNKSKAADMLKVNRKRFYR